MKTVCERGVVTAVMNGSVRVRLLSEEDCRKCGLAAIGLCRTGGAGFEIEAECPFPVRTGQIVRLLRGGRHAADGGASAFGIPVLALLCGALAGGVLADRFGFDSDLGAALFGFGLLVLSLLPTLWWHRRGERQGRFTPRVDRVLPGPWR